MQKLEAYEHILRILLVDWTASFKQFVGRKIVLLASWLIKAFECAREAGRKKPIIDCSKGLVPSPTLGRAQCMGSHLMKRWSRLRDSTYRLLQFDCANSQKLIWEVQKRMLPEVS